MRQEYKINGITDTWLHQPGMMVYVETEYNEEVNCVIKKHHHAIGDWCKENGLIFLYIPEFYKAGIRLFSVLTTGITSALGVPYSLYGESWIGEGEYDFSKIDNQMDMSA